ncbi:hypothetical protein GGI25_005795 [Coemansia spiralis]|uniref:Saccharopine dehydrogenase NADP binding domain-containing protein n=2 Tax=Coemansia TaxID=4863 RepID=A0A9W8FY04_9FUNG|nr:Saccharopine dehydrogenase-domain-containing protein [Coemansia spiralis]KAJ1987288.1 hypothetical protein EDC05_005908 [Coemansia umbellata]KAJ2619197.1 hypothetical protein GGI26_006016 [Coemansia sp. RSA 1358]KAJ2670550.1 hypothetical protein GGI25_005795 [Coemansia spiralis]
MAARKYDILVWGATGFTGKSLVEYLALNAPPKTRIAIGGRNYEKLKQVQAELDAKHPMAAIPVSKMKLLIGDSTDQEIMNRMAAQTRVVASTVGPYALYGSELVRACVRQKTDYCDITGEVPWVHQMHKELNAQAVQSNVHIVSLCGFDCIPADIGCMMMAEYAKEKLGKPLLHVKGSIVGIRGGVSGGTLATAITQLGNESKAVLKNIVQSNNPEKRQGNGDKSLTKRFRRSVIHYDETLKRWQTFWVMSSINAATARWAGRVLEYGPGFTYSESMSTHGLVHAVAIAIGLLYGAILVFFSFTRSLLYYSRIIPRPGDGPSKEFIRKGFFSLNLEAFTDSGVFYGKVSGSSDPGYGETIKYLGESALCLAFDRNENFRPGIYPPSVIMGSALLHRLRNKDCQFEVDKALVPSKTHSQSGKKTN